MIAILSGGLDSSVSLALAKSSYDIVQAITYDYGQKALSREVEQARRLSDYYQVPHLVLSLPQLASWTQTSLVRKDKHLPRIVETELDDSAKTKASAHAVWVPNRNGIFINTAAALAESRGIPYLLVGFNQEEGAAFPDNSSDFLEAVNKSLFYSTLNHVQVICPTISMKKSDIIQEGLRVNLPFEFIWSCYEGETKMCGQCESCLRLKRAAAEKAPQLLEVLAFAD